MKRIAILIAAVLLGAVASISVACDTPVYRYAMYRWEAAPYEVYYFHNAEASQADREVFARLEELASRAAPRTNVTLRKVDLRGDALEKLPPDVASRWQDREDKSTPAWLTVSPLGGLVSWQSLAPESVQALADSPARQQVAKELAAAKAGVFVVLSGSDKLMTQAAIEQVRQLVAKLDRGEVPLYRPPTDPIARPGAEGKADDAPRMAMVVVDRDDPQEQWFANSLLAVEGDLREIDKPMVFPVYGRARALPPYVGAGITASNLTDAVVFVTGACSCTVKDQNPGVDLLVSYDWASAADAMKQRFGSEEGNESFGDSALLTQLIIPGETGAASPPASPSAVAAAPLEREADSAAAPVPVQPVGQSQTGSIDESSPAVALAVADGHSRDTSVAHAGDDRGEEIGNGDSHKLLLTLAVGVGIAMAALAVGTFFVFRKE